MTHNTQHQSNVAALSSQIASLLHGGSAAPLKLPAPAHPQVSSYFSFSKQIMPCAGSH